MKKIAWLLVGIMAVVGIYTAYDVVVVELISSGQIADNGYNHNYIPELLEIAFK